MAVLTEPTTAERVRSAVLRASTSMLAAQGSTPVESTMLHMHPDGTLSIVVRGDCDAVAHTWQHGATGLTAVLEVTDHSPLPLRNQVRALVWVSGSLHPVASPRTRAAEIAAAVPDPALLDVGHRTELLELRTTSVVVADHTGAEAVDLAALRTARSDPFAEIEVPWLQHLDQDHSDLVERIALRVRRTRHGGPVRPLALDRYGLTLRFETPDGDDDVRIAFPSPAHDPASLSRALRVLVGCPFVNGLRSRP